MLRLEVFDDILELIIKKILEEFDACETEEKNTGVSYGREQ